jgi:hypothetical protein
MTLRYRIARLLMIVHEVPENAQTYATVFMHFVIILRFFPHAENTRHNIQLAEEGGQCPLACSSMMCRLVTFSHNTMKLFRIITPSKRENILSRKGSNPCSVNYNILPRRGQWTLANLLRQQNVMSCVLHTWKEPEHNDKMHEKCGVCLWILGCFMDYHKKARLSQMMQGSSLYIYI